MGMNDHGTDMAQQTTADDRSTELRNTDAEAVDGSTPGSDHTLYLDRDDSVQGTPMQYAPVEVRTEDGETYRGTCTTFSRVSGPTGGFYQHEVALHVAGLGTVWVHTGRGGQDEVELAAEDADQAWNEALGALEAVDFTVEYEDEQDEADPSSQEQQALAPEQVDEGDTVVLHYETRASHGTHTERVQVTAQCGDEWRLDVPEAQSGRGGLTLRDGEYSTWSVEKIEARARAERSSVHVKGTVVRVTTPERLAYEDEAETRFCMGCREYVDTVPMAVEGSRTGGAGCPECDSVAPVRRVVYEVGDERDVAYGYVPEGSRDHQGSLALEAAEAITQD